MQTLIHRGCRFHQNQSIQRKLDEIGLQSLYHQNPRFHELINKLYALCYIKVDDVVPVYNEHVLPSIQQTIDEDEDWQDLADELNDFGDYYDSTWIERRNHRVPRFAPVLWNHHDSIMSGGIQTNNHLESYNRTWNKLAGKDSNVWVVQELFVKQEANARRSFISKFILEGYTTLPKKVLLQMLSHELTKEQFLYLIVNMNLSLYMLFQIYAFKASISPMLYRRVVIKTSCY